MQYSEALIYISSGDALNKLLFNLTVIINDGRTEKIFGAHHGRWHKTLNSNYYDIQRKIVATEQLLPVFSFYLEHLVPYRVEIISF